MIENKFPIDKNQLTNAIKRWINSYSLELKKKRLISNHISEILGFPLAQNQWLPIALDAFEVLLTATASSGFTMQPHLIIALKSAKSWFALKPPSDLQKMFQQLNPYEPPSLYLINWDDNKYLPELYEELRVPLMFDLYTSPYENTVTYYSVFRSAHSLKHNWEFARSIHIVGFPKLLTE